jgi:hypothetical protein
MLGSSKGASVRVLVVGSVPVSLGEATEELERAGHDVVRCHEDTGPAFPCAALRKDGGCPFDGAPVDIVLDLHDARTGMPSSYEDGATCGIRQHVPLVLVADRASAFESWAAAKVPCGADLVKACETAATAPLPLHGDVATAAAKDSFARIGLDPGPVTAVVHRQGGTLKVTVTRPADSDEHQESMVMARVITAVRSLDKAARGVDISFA